MDAAFENFTFNALLFYISPLHKFVSFHWVLAMICLEFLDGEKDTPVM